MEESFIELIEGPELNFNINEYSSEYKILNDRSDKSSSGVWKHFGAIKHNGAVDKKHVYCIHCFYERKIKKYQRSTSTGNLSKHLRKQHHISLNQAFRVKKEADNSIHLIKKEEEGDDGLDKDNSYGQIEENDEYIVNDINEILISEVAKRPLLYRSHAYQQEKGVKHVLRRQLWNEVYEALNREIPLVKVPKTWKNIRDRYHKVRRLANTDGENKPKYRYYDLLRFLDSNEDQKSFEGNKSSSSQYEQIEEETDVDEYLVTETIVLPNEGVTYEEISCEPKTKRSRMNSGRQSTTTYQILNKPNTVSKNEPTEMVPVGTSNIIEESFANATSNDIYTTFEEELVTEDTTEEMHMQNDGIMSQSNIEMMATSENNAALQSQTSKKPDEFEIFGNLVAEVMRNMAKSRVRILQMNIMKLIADAENES